VNSVQGRDRNASGFPISALGFSEPEIAPGEKVEKEEERVVEEEQGPQGERKIS
jgi:hypothetical protein